MRVGLVTPYSWTVPGGVNDHIANLAYQLERRGHEPWVLGPVGGPGRSRQQLPERFIPVGSAVPFRSNGSKAYINTCFWMLQRMERILAANPFDILHCHEPCTPSVSASVVMRRNAPVVGTFHAALSDSLLYRYLHPLAKWVIESLTVRIAVSDAAKEFVEARFGGEYRIIPNGVAVERYRAAREGQRLPGRILFIGRAEPRKGLGVLLRAFVRLRERHPEATLVLVGPMWAHVHALADRPGSGLPWPIPGIAALGRVTDEVKVAEMATAEVLCVPSVEGESFGIVLAEGLAAGLPVVASDLPGYRSVLRDGRAGVLVPPGDDEELARALHALLADEARRRALAEAGTVVAEELSWERVADQVIRAYEDALELAASVPSLRTGL